MRKVRKDKIRNEYIRDTVKVERLGMKMREGRHEQRPGVCKKESDENGVTAKEEKREAKEKIFRCSEGGYGKVGAREKDIEYRTLWRNIIHCATPD